MTGGRSVVRSLTPTSPSRSTLTGPRYGRLQVRESVPGDRHGGFGERLGALVRREADGIFVMPAEPDRSVRHGIRMALGLAVGRSAGLQACPLTWWAQLGWMRFT